MIKTIGVWISKDGNKIENMSFFSTKKEATNFAHGNKGRDVVVSGILTFKLGKPKTKK